MSARTAPESVDAELGPMRWCARCEEWWPLDTEFWKAEHRKGATKVYWHCRCCVRERDGMRIILGPAACQGCQAPVVWSLGGNPARVPAWRNPDNHRRHFCPLPAQSVIVHRLAA